VRRPIGGIGWAGPLHETAPPVQVLGSTVIVSDLKYVEPRFFDDRPPLVRAFAALGADVLVESGFGQEGIVAELTCAGPPPRLAAVGGDLADYVVLPDSYLARPPWHPEGLTQAQRRARRTYRTIFFAQKREFQELIEGDSELNALRAKLSSASPEEQLELAGHLASRVGELSREQTQAGLSDNGLDAVVVGWFAATGGLATPPAGEEGLRRGEHLGRVRAVGAHNGQPARAPADADHQLFGAEVDQYGNRLDIGLVQGGRFAVYFPALVRHLHDRGCRKLAYALGDWYDAGVQ